MSQANKLSCASTFLFSFAIVCWGCFSASMVMAQTDDENRAYWIKANKTNSCIDYSKNAVEQNIINKRFSCGFTGARWSNEDRGQTDWCLTVSPKIYNKETEARAKLLRQCLAKVTTDIQMKLPSACLVEGYMPTRYLYSFDRYETEKREPVFGGYIHHDFNGDQRKDYGYLEYHLVKSDGYTFHGSLGKVKDPLTYKPKARLTFCLSEGEQWKHYPTKLSLWAGSQPEDYLYSTTHTIGLDSEMLHISSTIFGHNQGTGTRESWYKFSLKAKEFKLVDTVGKGQHFPDDPGMSGISAPSTPEL